MKQVLYLLSIIFLVNSCGQSSRSVHSQDLQTVTIDFADAEIKMPKNYKQVSPDELKKILISSDKPHDVVQANIRKIETLKTFPTDFIIYSDTTNAENNIWFQEGEHISLTKSLSEQYLSALEQQLQKEWTPQDIEYDRVESKYFAGSNAQIIKLKYKLTHESFSQYTTQYVISTRTKTMGIVINSQTLADYESMVKGMKIK